MYYMQERTCFNLHRSSGFMSYMPCQTGLAGRRIILLSEKTNFSERIVRLARRNIVSLIGAESWTLK